MARPTQKASPDAGRGRAGKGPAGRGPSFGDELRRERELREIALREVAEATKINLRYLEALERNDFAHLPGGVFNKGFVRAYCQFIGVDPETMVNAYLLEERAQATRDEPAEPAGLLRGRAAGDGASAASRRTAPAPLAKRRRRWPWIVLVLMGAGLIVAAVYYFALGAGRDLRPRPGGSAGRLLFPAEQGGTPAARTGIRR